MNQAKAKNYNEYDRKSTTPEERQALSLPSQREVNAEIARREGLHVTQVIQEAKSAKEPNKRPLFNQMIADIKAGKCDGIICWKLDRLARNPDEAGMIIGMLQRGEIKHIRTAEKSYYPEDNSLLSYVEFGIANEFIRDLSKNVKRGIDKKANSGQRPGFAPVGYLNSKTNIKGTEVIYTDEKRFTSVKELWRRMLTGNYSVPQLLKFANDELHLTLPATPKRQERKLRVGVLYRMFTNPFYYGWYEWPIGSGNWIAGMHAAMITEQEFDQVQRLLGKKGKPRPKTKRFAFTGLVHCGNCGAMVTAEEKVKHQKNGNTHTYVYYRCTRKIDPKCTEKAIKLEDFSKHVDSLLEKITISDRFRDWAIKHLHEIRKQEAQTQVQTLEATQKAYQRLVQQLDNLTLKYTSPENTQGQLISDQEYQGLKSRLLKEKSALELQLQQQGRNIAEWVELSERTFNFCRYARMWFEHGDLDTKRAIFACLGSHLLLKDQKLLIELKKPFTYIYEGLNQAETIELGLEPTHAPINIGQDTKVADKISIWSGIRESNPCPNLGKVLYCHYTNSANIVRRHSERSEESHSSNKEILRPSTLLGAQDDATILYID